jgi:bla regulator protein BlaR1
VDDMLNIALSNAVAATVLAVAAIAVGAVYRRPALVHGMWLLVLLKLVTPPLLVIPVRWPTTAERPSLVAAFGNEPTIATLPDAEDLEGAAVDPPTSERAFVSASSESTAPAAVAPPSVDVLGALTQPRSPAPLESSLWPQILRIVWAAGALLWFVVALERLHHFRRLLRFARPAPPALQERTRRLALSMGLNRCPRVRLLPGRIAPMLWSIGGPPRLFVPVDLLGVLSEGQLDTLLVHELAHLRRRDHWVRVLEFVVMGLYWWHPVVWYALRELREAEEQCCDAWVVSTLTDAGRTYASALLDTLDFLSTTQAVVPPLASGLSRLVDLKRRLTMIMQANTPRSLTWPGCLAIITLGLTCLPMLPSLQGQAPDKEEARKSVEDAKKELDKAKEALKEDEAILKQKMKELIRAQHELANESVRKALVQIDQHREQRLWIKDGKVAVRIEITFPAEDKEKANAIVARIRKAVPEDLKDKIKLHILPDGDRVIVAPPPPRTPAPPQPGAPRTKPLARTPPSADSDNAPQSRASEKRINDLEKKLQKVLEELQELRKQMRRPRGGSSSAPQGVPPGAGGFAPPAVPTPYAVPGQGSPPAGPSPRPAIAPPYAPPPSEPPAATPPPVPDSPAPNPGSAARRVPNPYAEYRSMC